MKNAIESYSNFPFYNSEYGKKCLTNCYNLDANISVGYRVNSLQATL